MHYFEVKFLLLPVTKNLWMQFTWSMVVKLIFTAINTSLFSREFIVASIKSAEKGFKACHSGSSFNMTMWIFSQLAQKDWQGDTLYCTEKRQTDAMVQQLWTAILFIYFDNLLLYQMIIWYLVVCPGIFCIEEFTYRSIFGKVFAK